MRMLDLCCGLGGASSAFKERGWEVVGVDADEECHPDIRADLRTLTLQGSYDLIWASPPCDEFARESMPWCKTGKKPDLSIVEDCRRIIHELRPRWWVMENVKGAVPYLGKCKLAIPPYYFWGEFPMFLWPHRRQIHHKMKTSGMNRRKRAKIPHDISLAFCLAMEANL